MNNSKHLLLSEGVLIEQHLNNRIFFTGIGKELSKHPTTISKEVKESSIFNSSATYGRPYNDCINRNSCTSSNTRGKLGCRNQICKSCAFTNHLLTLTSLQFNKYLHIYITHPKTSRPESI